MSDSDIIDCDNIYCFVEISRGGNLHACISGILYDDVGNGYGTVCVVAVLKCGSGDDSGSNSAYAADSVFGRHL